MQEDPQNLDTSEVREFFRELIREALTHQRVDAPEGVEFYLVNLLKDCLKSEHIFGPSEEPLATIFCRAVQSDTSEKVRLFRRLGDLSLYISGFFPMSLTRQLVDANYYVQMGECAYGNLSQLMASHSAFSEIYQDLAHHFVAYMDILAEVSEKSSMRNDIDLLRMYETWLKTGSERLRQMLVQEGIVPTSEVSQKIQ